jgi:competence protein ComEA
MRSKLALLLSEVRSSIWLRPILRLVLALAGVLALACIGRFVAAGGPVPPAAAASSETPQLADAAAAAPAEPSVDAAPSPLPPPAIAHGAHATEDDPVYLNEATLEDLRRLPGVGPKRAMAIVTLRTQLGRFRQIEDLLRVKGIGRATLKKLRPLVRLERRDAG